MSFDSEPDDNLAYLLHQRFQDWHHSNLQADPEHPFWDPWRRVARYVIQLRERDVSALTEEIVATDVLALLRDEKTSDPRSDYARRTEDGRKRVAKHILDLMRGLS